MAVRPSRADVISPKEKQLEYFSDFLNSFAKSPVGNQLARLTNGSSVSQSIKNLIKTNVGERLFQPTIGSNVYHSLFENLTPVLEEDLAIYIERTIKQNEPRANLLQIEVRSYLSAKEDILASRLNENEIEVTIVYSLINNPANIKLSMILKRVR